MDMESMFWRLNRFAEKKEITGALTATRRKKRFF